MDETPRDNLVRSAPFQLERDDGEHGDGLTLRGHGAVFNEWTTIDSWEGKFQERIAPGAFRKTLKESGHRVRLQFDHGQHPLVGSLPIGAIRQLTEDERGLFVEARLADNWLIQPVREAIENGSIDGMSFRFSVVNDRWEKQNTDMPERTITEVKLHELGPVVFPAYETTDVGVRSLELARSLTSADDQTRREIADILLRTSEASTDTQPEGAVDDVDTPDVEPSPDDEPATDHSRSITPAQRRAVPFERLAEDRARVAQMLADALKRSA